MYSSVTTVWTRFFQLLTRLPNNYESTSFIEFAEHLCLFFFSAMKRTTRGFDAKGNCSARTYEYLTPTYAFARDYVSHPQSSTFY